jgi:hypothetical protein
VSRPDPLLRASYLAAVRLVSAGELAGIDALGLLLWPPERLSEALDSKRSQGQAVRAG